MESIRVALAGIGGYGQTYVNQILDHPDARVKVVGLIDPYPEACRRLDELTAQGVPVYADMEAFFAADRADLMVISTPIPFHTPQILLALKNGANVLCEKPLCADEKDIPVLQEACAQAGKFVYIGFQWSYSDAVLALKRDVQAQRFGSCREMKTLVLWPRDEDYYHRGIGWAGKIRTADGQLIYDSVLSNATGHYLHNMLFVMGADGQSAMPERIEAQLWRANPIENFDTAKVDMTFAGGMQAHCLVSHAVAQQLNPVFMYRFEGATVFYAQSCDEHSAALTPEWYDRYDHILARTDDGRVYDYGSPFADPGRKLNQAVEAALQGETGPGPCGIEAASAHVRVINWLQKNAVIRTFAPEQCRKVHKLTYVDGLFERMLEAYRDPSRPLWEDERHA